MAPKDQLIKATLFCIVVSLFIYLITKI
jgi:hypothetical protein